MPNDICLNIPQPNSSLNLDLNTAPPPYSTEFDGFNSLVGHLQHTHLAEQQQASPEPVEPSPIAALQLKIVTSSSDNWYSTPYECSCVLEDRFLLLAYREGIQLVDLADKTAKPHIIMWTRIRQIRVIESCRIILMLADKSKPVRCYSYDAILRLIYSVLSLDWSTRRDKMFDVPSLKDWQQVASKSAMNTTPDGEEEEEVPVSAINGLGLAFKERLAKKQKEKVPVDKQACFVVDQPALTKPYYVCGKLIPQEFYYKLSDSKEALDIQSYQTSAYLFVAILHRDKIVLWQRRRDHPLRHFYRFKVFWIPAEAKSISFADDRNTLRHIITVFTSDATSIELRDCKVQTINIDPTLRRIYESTWIREQYEHQLVSPNSPVSIPTKEANPALNENSMLYPTLPASVSVPPIQWTSILQLPFYPDNLPPTTLTTEYSIPPSYATVITTLPTSAPPDPVALPSASAPQLFFATLSKQSFIIDITGSLYSTQVFCWSESPTHVEFIQLDVDTNQWYAVGFGSATVEIMDMKTGKVLQKVMHGVPVKFLGQWNESIVEGSSSKKTKARFKSLIWSCAAKDRSHVYMLKYQ